MPRILAIDDKQDNLTVLKAIIGNMMPDCILLTALSGQEGLEKAASMPPDVILLDVVMPGMDGYEVCRSLRADHKTKHIPIIMLTAVHTDNRARGLDAGADAFLCKPVEEQELVAQLRAMLRIKKAEDSLLREKEDLVKDVQASEANYREIFDATSDTIFVCNAGSGEIIDVNRSVEDTYGYTPEEALQLKIGGMSSGEPGYTSDDADREIAKAINEGQNVFEWRMKKKSGDFFWVEINIKRTIIGDSQCLLAVVGDIDERKRIEGEKEKLEEKLRQSYKMEAIGTLAGGIAHDFNNILAIIMGNLDMALHDLPADHPVYHSLEQISEASVRARDLVNQILIFSREGKEELIPLRPQSIINKTLNLLRSATPTTVSIEQSVSEDCGTVMADPTQLHQLLMNLFTNSVHAMAEKGEVEVSLQEVDLCGEESGLEGASPGAYVMLSVTDNGVGMDKETIDRIFDPFYTTKAVGEGTGMGLSVVHGIVESHGGMITVESKPGKGSVFKVYLPVVKHEEVPESADYSAPPPTGNESILFVDDEENLAVLGRRMLERLGYQVTSETSSVAILEILKSDPNSFDLLITDQSMPDMSGLELIGEVLKIRPDMPIILCTGYSSKVSEENVKKMGVRELVMKPYEKKLLAEAIRRALDS